MIYFALITCLPCTTCWSNYCQLVSLHAGLLWQGAAEILWPEDQRLCGSSQAHPCLHPPGSEESAPWSHWQVEWAFAFSASLLLLTYLGYLQWVSLSLRYYGCGLVVPECLEGCKILDLGSGSGRDCYMLSQLVGESGHVTGIDMTEDQVLYISITVVDCLAAVASRSMSNMYMEN